jgi:hypothetical protein
VRRLSTARRELWVAIRAEYESGVTVAQLARSSGVSEQHVRRVKRAESWEKPELAHPEHHPEHLRGEPEHLDRLRHLVVLNGGGKAARRAVWRGRGSDPNISPTDDDVVASMRLLAAQLLEDAIVGRIEPGLNQSRADVALRVVMAAARTIDASRLVAGKLPGQPSTARSDEAQAKHVTIIRRTTAVGDSR